eukprot:15438931-Alexandrium_andersonii.AAC.1
MGALVQAVGGAVAVGVRVVHTAAASRAQAGGYALRASLFGGGPPPPPPRTHRHHDPAWLWSGSRTTLA